MSGAGSLPPTAAASAKGLGAPVYMTPERRFCVTVRGHTAYGNDPFAQGLLVIGHKTRFDERQRR